MKASGDNDSPKVVARDIFCRWKTGRTSMSRSPSWEEYDRALIIKRFLFEMLDAYGCLAYLGFVLSDSEALRSLLLTMLLTDSLRRFVIESLIPLILYQFRMWHEKRVAAKKKRAADCDTLPNPTIDWSNYKRELCAETYEPFDDYLEMVLQHGYLVLFAYVCPLLGAPIALVSTFFEAHSDAFKMLRVTRRPSPRLLIRGSFIWLVLLGAQAWLSILTNVGLFVSFLHTHSTEFDTDLSFLFLILEHGLFVVAICIHFFIQDVPSVVRDARRSREFRRVNLFSAVPNAT
ncbi:Anoctamin-10 [Clonorchis sinensis]|uniref:Anoctamin n=1 Tax=Clonorchis sinensis TaxID=79923 RepID=A0A8T1M6D0_CLOSI|nr:Anoctamin-10 [Clonorchis sinensis]